MHFDKGKPGESQRRKAIGAAAAKARHASQLPYDREQLYDPFCRHRGVVFVVYK
jgi:hypothetical protein